MLYVFIDSQCIVLYVFIVFVDSQCIVLDVMQWSDGRSEGYVTYLHWSTTTTTAAIAIKVRSCIDST